MVFIFCLQKNLGISYELKLPLILIHTPFGLKFFDKIANSKFGHFYAKFNIYLMPLITALAVFLIVGSLLVLFSNDSAREGVREIGPQGNLLIPGLNPILPWTYGWIGLVVTIIIHEAGHGIVARVYNTKVESTGVVLFLAIPIGAFVNIQQDELNRTSFKQKSAILTAGPMNNMILAGICLGLLFLLVSSLSPVSNISGDEAGITVLTVSENSLAKTIGLEKNSVITFINNEPIESIDELRNILRNNLGNTIQINWINEDKKLVNEVNSTKINLKKDLVIKNVITFPKGKEFYAVPDTSNDDKKFWDLYDGSTYERILRLKDSEVKEYFNG